jgi:hypothetical protein
MMIVLTARRCNDTLLFFTYPNRVEKSTVFLIQNPVWGVIDARDVEISSVREELAAASKIGSSLAALCKGETMEGQTSANHVNACLTKFD